MICVLEEEEEVLFVLYYTCIAMYISRALQVAMANSMDAGMSWTLKTILEGISEQLT